jgi:ABC-type transport system involved in cytochrome bd biosynthesis fused ATPase/permease subunit
MVMQQVHLVDGTLRDNVALGRPDASDDEVRHALRLAHLDHLVGTGEIRRVPRPDGATGHVPTA